MAKRLRDVKILEASDWTTDRYKKGKKNESGHRPPVRKEHSLVPVREPIGLEWR